MRHYLSTRCSMAPFIYPPRMFSSFSPIATAIIQRGTLKRGNILVSGTAQCKVRAMFNELGQQVQSAGPGIPVELIGWRKLPSAGDVILQVESEVSDHHVPGLELRRTMASVSPVTGLGALSEFPIDLHHHHALYPSWGHRAAQPMRCNADCFSCLARDTFRHLGGTRSASWSR